MYVDVRRGILAPQKKLRGNFQPIPYQPPAINMTDNPFQQTLGHVFITGGCGFLGSHMVELLLERHPQTKVTILDLRDSPNRPTDRTNFFACDITDATAVEEIFQKSKPDVVIHTASPVAHGTAKMNEAVMLKVNVDGTKVLLKAAQESGVKAFVYTSSASVSTQLSVDSINIDERWPLIMGKDQPDYYTHTKVYRIYIPNCNVRSQS
jgi:sterol-4alpha-carboxylate 3-dehydrogenase (decarboxylating)